MKQHLCVIIGGLCRASFFSRMKISSILVCLFTAILTAGCAPVVYRVNPDSPPKLGVTEARDAVELALSIRIPRKSVESMHLDRDEVVAMYSEGNRSGFFTAGYGDISQEIMKTGDFFQVRVDFQTGALGNTAAMYGMTSISWKSEEDARLFIDGIYALRQWRIAREKGTTTVAQSPATLLKKDVPPEPPARKEKAPQIKSAGPDLAQLKPAPSTSPPQAEPETPQPAVSKKRPPKITITAPDVSRSVKVVARQSTVTVIGIAESKSGIAEVTVNGIPADLDEHGNFSRDALLKVGQNSITVAAMDIYGNRATHELTIYREGGKVAQARKEEPTPAPKLPSANYYALFIAVQDYDSADIGRLDYAISDARRLRDILVSNYTFEKENTIILENPDRKTIYKTLQVMRKKLADDDSLLIFYAGHGYWMDDMRQGFWLPRDAAGLNDPSDWIPNSNIRDYIKAIKARHVLLVADACFSGGMFKVREVLQKQQVSIEKIYELPSRKAITSGSMKTVPDRSVFLEYLVKRLKDNDDLYMDTQKLFTSLREAVINNSPTHQTPLYGAISEAGDEGGDFIFVRRQ